MLAPREFAYVADGGHVLLDILPVSTDAELFERSVPFGTSAATVPFTRVPGIYAADQPNTHATQAPLGGLYEARLYSRGDVPAGAQPGVHDTAYGRAVMACLAAEGRDPSLLTSCRGSAPQLLLGVGGNYLSASVATGTATTRTALFVGGVEPQIYTGLTGDVPRYDYATPIATGFSDGPARLHRVLAPADGLLSHTDRIVPQQDIWFFLLAWTDDGRWDYVWSSDASGGVGDPQQLTTRTCAISVSVDQLTCVNDDSFGGDPVYTLTADGGGDVQSTSFTWDDMDDGTTVADPLSLQWSGGQESEQLILEIKAGNYWDAGYDLDLPVGDGSLSSTHTFRMRGAGLDGTPGFFADLTVAISYS